MKTTNKQSAILRQNVPYKGQQAAEYAGLINPNLRGGGDDGYGGEEWNSEDGSGEEGDEDNFADQDAETRFGRSDAEVIKNQRALEDEAEDPGAQRGRQENAKKHKDERMARPYCGRVLKDKDKDRAYSKTGIVAVGKIRLHKYLTPILRVSVDWLNRQAEPYSENHLRMYLKATYSRPTGPPAKMQALDAIQEEFYEGNFHPDSQYWLGASVLERSTGGKTYSKIVPGQKTTARGRRKLLLGPEYSSDPAGDGPVQLDQVTFDNIQGILKREQSRLKAKHVQPIKEYTERARANLWHDTAYSMIIRTLIETESDVTTEYGQYRIETNTANGKRFFVVKPKGFERNPDWRIFGPAYASDNAGDGPEEVQPCVREPCNQKKHGHRKRLSGAKRRIAEKQAQEKPRAVKIADICECEVEMCYELNPGWTHYHYHKGFKSIDEALLEDADCIGLAPRYDADPKGGHLLGEAPQEEGDPDHVRRAFRVPCLKGCCVKEDPEEHVHMYCREVDQSYTEVGKQRGWTGTERERIEDTRPKANAVYQKYRNMVKAQRKEDGAEESESSSSGSRESRDSGEQESWIDQNELQSSNTSEVTLSTVATYATEDSAEGTEDTESVSSDGSTDSGFGEQDSWIELNEPHSLNSSEETPSTITTYNTEDDEGRTNDGSEISSLTNSSEHNESTQTPGELAEGNRMRLERRMCAYVPPKINPNLRTERTYIMIAKLGSDRLKIMTILDTIHYGLSAIWRYIVYENPVNKIPPSRLHLLCAETHPEIITQRNYRVRWFLRMFVKKERYARHTYTVQLMEAMYDGIMETDVFPELIARLNAKHFPDSGFALTTINDPTLTFITYRTGQLMNSVKEFDPEYLSESNIRTTLMSVLMCVNIMAIKQQTLMMSMPHVTKCGDERRNFRGDARDTLHFR